MEDRHSRQDESKKSNRVTGLKGKWILFSRNMSAKEKRSWKAFFILIVILVMLLVILPIFSTIEYFVSERGSWVNTIYHASWSTHNPTQKQVEAIEKEFGFTLPSDWKLTSFNISSGRGLQTSVVLEGELEDINEIREYLPYDLPDDIEVSVFKERVPSEYGKGSYEVQELRTGLIFFFRRHFQEENYYNIRIYKVGLRNKFLQCGLEKN